MNELYQLIGRLVVQAIRARYGRQIRIAGAVGIALAVLGVGAYIATREGDEEQV